MFRPFYKKNPQMMENIHKQFIEELKKAIQVCQTYSNTAQPYAKKEIVNKKCFIVMTERSVYIGGHRHTG